MGDWTTSEMIVFQIIIVAIPALIFGLPIAALGFLSARRTIQLNQLNQLKREPQNEMSEHNCAAKGGSTSGWWPWFVAVLLLVVTAGIAYLIYGMPLSGFLE